MKAITLWQPWASLMACGAKQFETRSWATSYRGPIAIHAAQTPLSRVLKTMFPLHEWEYAPDHKAKRDFLRAVADALRLDTLDMIEDLPRGRVLAAAELAECHKMVRHGGRGLSSEGPGWLEADGHYGIFDQWGCFFPSETELLFGDWTPGRYAWEFANMQMLPQPIPAKGGQRIWNWEAQRGGTADV